MPQFIEAPKSECRCTNCSKREVHIVMKSLESEEGVDSPDTIFCAECWRYFSPTPVRIGEFGDKLPPVQDQFAEVRRLRREIERQKYFEEHKN